MIIKASERGGWRDLARHLSNEHDNDVVEIDHVAGFMNADLAGAFQEIYAVSKATNCKNYMVSISLSPPADAELGKDAFRNAAQQALKRLGLADQPHALVFHEKGGRRHAHLVASRIDGNAMKAINLSFYKEKLCDLSRDLFVEHGIELPQGHVDRALSSDLNYTLAEHQSAKRAKRDPQVIKQALKLCWAQTDDRNSFDAALNEAGFRLCQGDRRGFVVVDAEDNFYSLSRFLEIKPKDLRAKLGDADLLPSIDEIPDELRPPKTVVPETAQKQKALEETHLQTRERHLQVRKALKSEHAAKRTALIAKFQRERTGLRGIWNRITGDFRNIIHERQKQLQSLDEEFERRLLEVSDRQRKEMRALCAERSALAHAMENERFPETVSFTADRFVSKPDPKQALQRALIQKSPDSVLDIISDTKAQFSRNDIVRSLSDALDDQSLLRHAVDQVVQSPKLVCVADEKSDNPKFSTRSYLELDTKLHRQVQYMANQAAFGVKERHLREAIASQNRRLRKSVGARLSEEQENAVRHVLSRNQFSAVVGLAGAGKSTMLSAAKEAWEAQGYRVLGAALAGKAVDGLTNASDIQSRTLASWELSWKNGRNELKAGDVLVIDEAGMVPTRQLARFIDQAAKKRVKVVLVGDPDQLQPIQAGRPFADILATINHARLTEIRRQSADWQKQASLDLARGDIKKALQAYDEHDCVVRKEDRDSAIESLVEDYMIDLELNGKETTRLALAHRNKDVFEINQRVRLARKSAGELNEELMVQTDRGPRSIAVSDRVVFTKNDAALGIRNGMFGTVTKLRGGSFVIVPDEPNGEAQITIDPIQYNAVEHGYASTIHKAQGTTICRSFMLASGRPNKHLAYVGLTRHRTGVTVYGSDGDIAKLAELGTDLTQYQNANVRQNTHSSVWSFDQEATIASVSHVQRSASTKDKRIEISIDLELS